MCAYNILRIPHQTRFASSFLPVQHEENKAFQIKDTTLSVDYENKIKQFDKDQKEVFFEDSSYIVRRTCMGEWGGSVWFKNKKTGKWEQLDYFKVSEQVQLSSINLCAGKGGKTRSNTKITRGSK